MNIHKKGAKVDVERGELVEKELPAFVEKRERQPLQTEGERRREEAWMESERRYTARRSAQAVRPAGARAIAPFRSRHATSRKEGRGLDR